MGSWQKRGSESSRGSTTSKWWKMTTSRKGKTRTEQPRKQERTKTEQPRKKKRKWRTARKNQKEKKLRRRRLPRKPGRVKTPGKPPKWQPKPRSRKRRSPGSIRPK